MNKNLVNSVNKVTTYIDNELKKFGFGGCCLIAARLGREALIEEGFEHVNVVKGHHAAGINKGPYGLISSAHLAEMDYSEGNLHHHYWLDVQGRVVDFSHLRLHQKVKELDQESGIPSGPIKINTRPLVSKSLIKSRSALKNYCEIGYYYEPIACGYNDAYSADVSIAIALLNANPANDAFQEQLNLALGQ